MGRMRSSWWWGGLAFAGIVVTHAVTYRVVEHDHAARHALLEQTGHRYWMWVAAVGVAAAVAVSAAFVVRTARSSGHGRVAVWRLALLQGGGWLLLEGVERIGAEHGSWVDKPVLVGLLVQVAVAVVGVVLLALLAKAVRFLVTPRPPRARSPQRQFPPIILNGCWPRFAPAAPRGPPSR